MTYDVGVTTSADSFPRWAEQMEGHGVRPVSLPCVEMVPAPEDELQQVRRLAEAAEALLFTSARAVRVLWPDGDMPAVPSAAVGPTTAQTVKEAGGVVELVGRAGAKSLLQEWEVGERRVVFPHAEGADLSHLHHLEARGASVTARTVYSTRPLSPGPDPVDAAVFASPSAVDGWLLSRTFSELAVVGAIGPTTADAIEVAGGRADAVPALPDVTALTEALAAALERKK